MQIQNLNIFYVFLIAIFISACDSKPRVIESESSGTNIHDIPDFKEAPEANNSNTEEHKVVVEEVLNTDKYTYLNVTENGKKYWVAVSKREAAVGDTFYFKGGLLKKNFQSREFNRVFETVYLVSNIWKNPGESGSETGVEKALNKSPGGESVDLEVGNIQPAEGAIKLSELFSNKEKYKDKLVKITGKCVKVNPMIMNRNWVHVKDSSSDDMDLTVTTTENIPLGAVVTLEGTIALDRDFGAGYRYDIIMEGAVLK